MWRNNSLTMRKAVISTKSYRAPSFVLPGGLMKILLTLSLCSCGLVSCRTRGVNIHFKNTSARDFQVVTARILGEQFIFNDLKRGQTRKIRVEKAYRYCLISVVLPQDTLWLIPVDYVGEKLYADGTLKIELSIGVNALDSPMLQLQTKRGFRLLP